MHLHARSTRVFVTLSFLLAAACSSDDSDGTSTGPEDSGTQSTQDATTSNPDSGTTSKDAGHDSSTPDAGADASKGGGEDAGNDATTPDSGTPDTGSGADANHEDASQDDAGPPDASAMPPLLGAWTFDDAPGASLDAGSSTSTDGGAATDASTDAGETSDAATDGGDASVTLSSADVSGNGHAAVFFGGASFGTGKSGGGLALDGSTGYADVGVTLVDTTKSFTVMSWITLNVLDTWEIALSEDDVNGSLFGLKLRGDNSNDFDFDEETSDIMNPGFVVAQSPTAATTATWTHLVGVYDSTGNGAVKLYVNGALVANASPGQAMPGATGHFLIGRGLYNGAVGSFFNGTIDDVAVYGGALTDAQVAAIYTAQQ